MNMYSEFPRRQAAGEPVGPEGSPARAKFDEAVLKSSENADSQFTDSFSTENKSRWEKFTDGAKNFARMAYEAVHKVPVLRRIVGKLEIANHGFWMKRNEDKAFALKEKITNTDSKIRDIQKSRDEISKALEDLKKENIPSTRSFDEQLRAMEGEEAKLMEKRERFQGKLEVKNEKMQKWAERRNSVVDKFIGRSKEKLKSTEGKLEGLKDDLNQAEFRYEAAEVKHRKQSEVLKTLREKKDRLINAFKKAGVEQWEIDEMPEIAAMNKRIDDGFKAIKEARLGMREKMDSIRKRGRKVENKVGGFKYKVKEFERIKAGTPKPVGAQEFVPYEPEDESVVGGETETATESSAEAEKTMKWSEFIKMFNEFLAEEDGNGNSPEKINSKELINVTGDDEIKFKDFEGVVPIYLKSIKVKSERIGSLLKKFNEEKVQKAKNSTRDANGVFVKTQEGGFSTS